ncbi:MAG: hypothetical protein ABI273_01205 [Lacunisphaera sp.]
MNPTPSPRRWPFVVGFIVFIVLVEASYLFWTHSHEGGDHAHHHGEHEAGALSLNDGQRWATDEPLRLGMQRIRDAVAPAVAGPARLTLDQQQANILSNAVQENVAYLIQNCKLEPAADANLHFLITELVTGAALVAADPRSEEGAMKLTHALAEYPRYFNHPNWSPLPAPALPVEKPDGH